MLKSTNKSVLDFWFHTDHKHGASLWLNKPALLEQEYFNKLTGDCEATEAKQTSIYPASHLNFTG